MDFVQIVHRRLAARNILLTFIHDVRVAGFGPQHKDGDQDAEAQVSEVLNNQIHCKPLDRWRSPLPLWKKSNKA